MGGRFRQLSRRLRAPFGRRTALAHIGRFHAAPRSLEAVVDSALDLGPHGLYRVQAAQVRSELLALAEAVRALRPRTILEIGTHQGGTLFLWAQLASERVISCDIADLAFRQPLFEAFPAPGSGLQVTHLCGDSHDSAFRRRVEAALAGAPVDFLFIDADHSEAGVRADFADYSPLVRPGGLVALHDIAGETIRSFWREIEATCDTRSFVEAGRGFGIGLVCMGAAAGA